MKHAAVQPIPFQLRMTSAVVLSLCANAGALAATEADPPASVVAAVPAAQAQVPESKPLQVAQLQVAEVEFDDTFLQRPGGTRIDVSRFNKGNVALPGEYRLDLYVNQIWVGRTAIWLRAVGGDERNVQPCFNRQLLDRMGVNTTKLTPEALARLQAAETTCVTLPELVQDASAVFDNGEQRLDVSIPQVAMVRAARRYVDPAYWDDGIPAVLLNYNANVYHLESDGNKASTQSYLGLNGGINYMGWRFRHVGSLTHTDEDGNLAFRESGTHYQSIQTYLQHGIAMIKSQVTIGDSFTDGAMFDSVGVRGVQLGTDDRMYPESQRGYAPTIHGIANSNARVQVRQNGNIIYETTVSPGAFEINDLYATGYGGDLEVIVTEADGSVRISRQPYTAAVNALRPGVWRYNVAAGQYRNSSIKNKPMMVMGTVQYGFSNLLTGYGGAVLADGYYGAVIGAALNTDIGAFSVDVSQASTALENQENKTGQSLRLAYSKLIAPTNTNLTLAAYRYSSSGYLSLADAVTYMDLEKRGLSYAMTGVQRNRFQVTINQTLPQGWGSFYLTGSAQNYWNREGSDTQYQVGWNNSYKRLNYGVSAARQYDPLSGKWDTRVMLTLGIPLGTGPHAPYSSTSVSHSSRTGETYAQESVTGTLGEDNNFSYGVNVGHRGGGDTDSNTSGGANINYVSPFTTMTASVSKGSGYTQTGAGVSGGLVAYSGGVVFTPWTGDTVGIIEAKDAAGARLTNAPGLRLDPWGRALVSSLLPYSDNQVDIDPKGLPMSVELKSSEQHVAPTSGAVVRLKFETENAGRAAIIRATGPDGKPLPFGAEVFDAKGDSVGSVAQAGRIIVRGVKTDSGQLTVTWGPGAGESCKLNYQLPPVKEGVAEPFATVEGVCQQ